MDKKLIEKLKEKLEEQKKSIQKELESFAFSELLQSVNHVNLVCNYVRLCCIKRLTFAKWKLIHD